MTKSVFPDARDRFVRDTSGHEMHLLRDDGLYRHVRFQAPDTITYFFDLVTWPGHLAIVGDAGNWVFARTADMFEFFVSPGRASATEINPQYWSEKLVAPRSNDAERYSHDLFKRRVKEWLDDVGSELEPSEEAALRAAADEQLLADWLDAAHSEHEAHRLLVDFEHDGRRIYDSWEWSLREYRSDFLWCCHAIVWGIAKYRAASIPAPSSEVAA